VRSQAAEAKLRRNSVDLDHNYENARLLTAISNSTETVQGVNQATKYQKHNLNYSKTFAISLDIVSLDVLGEGVELRLLQYR
jgi:hypothetical protein